MKVIFSHGKESGPWGRKIQRLAAIARDAGCDVDSIDYTDTFDSKVRVDRLLERLRSEVDRVILVGSSMGGYVSLVAAGAVEVAGLFLLAPALSIDGYRRHDYQPRCKQIEIVHGWSDDVVPVAGSIRFAQQIDCSLHLISGDHRLESSLPVIADLFRVFLQPLLKKGAA